MSSQFLSGGRRTERGREGEDMEREKEKEGDEDRDGGRVKESEREGG